MTAVHDDGRRTERFSRFDRLGEDLAAGNTDPVVGGHHIDQVRGVHAL